MRAALRRGSQTIHPVIGKNGKEVHGAAAQELVDVLIRRGWAQGPSAPVITALGIAVVRGAL
jgi:hypothetical protein